MRGMLTRLKKAEDGIDDVVDYVHFAVNEQVRPVQPVQRMQPAFGNSQREQAGFVSS